MLITNTTGLYLSIYLSIDIITRKFDRFSETTTVCLLGRYYFVDKDVLLLLLLNRPVGLQFSSVLDSSSSSSIVRSSLQADRFSSGEACSSCCLSR